MSGKLSLSDALSMILYCHFSHRGSSVAVEMSLLKQLREKEEKAKAQSFLGQIHLDLAKYHDQGRFR